MKEMPNLPERPGCWCYPDGAFCVCGDSEAVLRWWAYKPGYLPAMTPEQREWALDEIASVEGYRRSDHEGESDVNLSKSVLGAWVDFCRDKGLI